jgi:heat shock factor-binding protein 1
LIEEREEIMSARAPQSAEELTQFVQSMLQQMQARFQEMSDEIITKIDDLGNRIDELDLQTRKLSDRESSDAVETATTKKK